MHFCSESLVQAGRFGCHRVWTLDQILRCRVPVPVVQGEDDRDAGTSQEYL